LKTKPISSAAPSPGLQLTIGTIVLYRDTTNTQWPAIIQATHAPLAEGASVVADLGIFLGREFVQVTNVPFGTGLSEYCERTIIAAGSTDSMSQTSLAGGAGSGGTGGANG
jgi:hypothetical protein